MLNQIHLSNFKSFSDITIPLSPMTLFAGLNNSGKSSVIQAFRMLWKCSDTGDPSLGNLGALKEIKNIKAARSASIKIACFFQKKDKVELEIDFAYPDKPRISPIANQTDFLPLMSYVSADRWGPRVYLPIYTAMGDVTHVGEYGEYVLDFLSRHEMDIVAPELRHPDAEGDILEYNVRAWLEEISPNVKFEHATDPKRDTAYATIDGFRPPNTGFGLSYTLPVIVSLLGMSAEWKDETEEKLKSERGTLVMLENPEAHLHPQAQTAMGRMIACAAAAGVQVIVETHSDHLMDGIRIAAKYGLLDAEKTVFHYFTMKNEYESTITSPKLHPNGKLDYWPEGFFDQTLKNRAKLARR
ncbi:DUF3696 domain-containing protein [Desulfococcaceae bacterium HSG8]|nr:DUF3696 domain-containing protein [Desulfococcaceae bacterium HSG8]